MMRQGAEHDAQGAEHDAQGAEGDFRSNLHRGGTSRSVRIAPEERSTAVRAANVMGLNVRGADLLRSDHGPVVMEVNAPPGQEGIEKATDVDVASRIIQFPGKNAGPKRTKAREPRRGGAADA